MENSHENTSGKFSLAGDMPWQDWIQAMQENSDLLRQLLEGAQWEPLQRAIHDRDFLLRAAAERLDISSRKQPKALKTEDASYLKTALQSAMEVNRDCMEFLQGRRSDLKAKIGEASKGRKLLKLYKTHRQAAPRFFDKLG